MFRWKESCATTNRNSLESKFIRQFILVAYDRMFLTALIVPGFEMLREQMGSHGITVSGDTDLIQIEDVRILFEQEFHSLQKDLPTYERVRPFELLSGHLAMESGEMTPTLKVK